MWNDIFIEMKKTRKPVLYKQMMHQIRIIGGVWKRTPLLVCESEGLRPTPDRVRETLFNWLHHFLCGNWSSVRCLDLFAGSGGLGFEAASRGALEVTLIEKSAAVARQLEAVKLKLNASQVQIVADDAYMWLKNNDQTARFELIFLDPPYHQGWLAKILPFCQSLLVTDGLLYIESEFALHADDWPVWLKGWELLRADKAGIVFYHLLKKQYHSIEKNQA